MVDIPTQPGPVEQDWRDDTDLHVLKVRRFDENDTLVDNQWFVLIEDETIDGGFLCSSVSTYSE